MKVKLLRSTSKAPAKAHQFDAGFDLFADIESPIHFEFGQRILVPTGCALAIPEGYYGRIADRSSMSWKHGIHVLGGVIDSQFRGEVKVVLSNLDHGSEGYTINPGDKIAQLIITKLGVMDMEICDDLDNTIRGSGGFGSTGK